jgi:hypothetical protein
MIPLEARDQSRKKEFQPVDRIGSGIINGFGFAERLILQKEKRNESHDVPR